MKDIIVEIPRAEFENGAIVARDFMRPVKIHVKADSVRLAEEFTRIYYSIPKEYIIDSYVVALTTVTSVSEFKVDYLGVATSDDGEGELLCSYEKYELGVLKDFGIVFLYDEKCESYGVAMKDHVLDVLRQHCDLDENALKVYFM